MKRTDWALIAFIVVIVGAISWFVASQILPAPNRDPQTVPTAKPISTSIVQPSDTVFIKGGINPTVPVTIGPGGDNTPFNLGQN
jgi:hypothetical protein